MAFLSHDMVGIIGKTFEQVLMPCKALGGELYGIQACPQLRLARPLVL